MGADGNANSELRERDTLSQKALALLSRCEIQQHSQYQGTLCTEGGHFLAPQLNTELVRLEKTLRSLIPTTNLTLPDPSLNYVPKSHLQVMLQTKKVTNKTKGLSSGQ